MEAYLVAVIFCVSVLKSDALNCIHCDTNDTKGCGDPFDSSLKEKYSVDCATQITKDGLEFLEDYLDENGQFKPDTLFSCAKLIWGGFVSRTCGLGSEAGYCAALKEARDAMLREENERVRRRFVCRACFKDLCNTGTILKASSHVFSLFL